MFCRPRRCGKLAVEYVRPTDVVHCAVYSRKLGSETFGATSSEDYADIFLGVEKQASMAFMPYFFPR